MRRSRPARVSWTGWARSQEMIQMEIDLDIQLNLDFGKTLRIYARRLRRNLDMGTFPKFF
jgi:hypothetical protein